MTDKTIAILRTRDLTQLAVARSLLEAHGIPCLTVGEQTVGLFARHDLAGLFNRRATEAELRVPVAHAQVARDLLEESTDLAVSE